MFENKTEAQAREEILAMVAEYADRFHNQTKEFSPGDRIPYASRVYDKQEMVNLVDSSLEFWLTSGRYTDEFEKKLAEYLHVRYCSLVNSGSSANLVAFMALTSPLLGERRVKRGDEIITVAAGFPTTVTPAIQYGELPLGYDHKYVYSHFGYNLKATDMQAAIGCAQLDKFPSFVERRRHNFDRLKAALAGTEEKLILPEAADHSRPSWFGFLITCKEGVDRNRVVQYVEDHGVQTRMLFAGNLTKHPCFDEMRAEKKGYRIVGELKNTDRIMTDTFWVGVYPGMTDEKIDYMAKVIKEGLEQ